MALSTRIGVAACALWLATPLRSAPPGAEPQDVAPPKPARLAPIVLDAGHGGKDLGAVVRGRYEKDLALAIARRVQRRLEESGRPVRLTRDSDRYVELDQRVGDSLSWDGAVFVSLHLNKMPDRRLRGMSVYAFGEEPRSRRTAGPRRRLPPLASPPRERTRESLALAAAFIRDLRTAGFEVEPLNRASYYVLKNPAIPSVLIELGYMSNPEEAERLADPKHQDRIAAALARSLQRHLASPAAVAASTGR